MSPERGRRSTYTPEDMQRMARWGGLSEEYVQGVEQERLENSESFRRAENAIGHCNVIFEHLRPEVAALFVNPNVVLALAGKKGMADLPWAHIEQEDFDALEKLNDSLGSKKINISISKKPMVAETELYYLTVINYEALEWKTATTRFDWIPAYSAATAGEGYSVWLSSFHDAVSKAKRDGKLQEEVDEDILIEGILLGYPDQAILDFEEDYRLTAMDRVVEVSLDYPQEFRTTSATPDFGCYPEHVSHQDVREYVDDVNAIFDHFYNSDWFQRVQGSEKYQNARTKYREGKEKGVKLLHKQRNMD